MDTLANRVGERAIYRIAPVSSDVPERSVRRIPAMAPDSDATWPNHWPRPARLLVRPEPIETVALLPDHPPVSFTWRGIRRRHQWRVQVLSTTLATISFRCLDGPSHGLGRTFRLRREVFLNAYKLL